YGISDEDTLSNLFASYPQTFSTFPRTRGSQGLYEPVWNLRFDHEIHLQNDFPSGRTRLQRVKAPIPGPEIDPLPSIRRARSQWELVDSDEDILPSIVVRVEPQACFLSNKQSKNLPFKTRPL
ncbi:hypothetical protein FOC4_g10000386, partial [Fusarium odoratissimum]